MLSGDDERTVTLIEGELLAMEQIVSNSLDVLHQVSRGAIFPSVFVQFCKAHPSLPITHLRFWRVCEELEGAIFEQICAYEAEAAAFVPESASPTGPHHVPA